MVANARSLIEDLRELYKSDVKPDISKGNQGYAWAILANYDWAFAIKSDLRYEAIVDVHCGFGFLGTLHNLSCLLEKLHFNENNVSQHELEMAVREFEAFSAQTKLPLAKDLKH